MFVEVLFNPFKIHDILLYCNSTFLLFGSVPTLNHWKVYRKQWGNHYIGAHFLPFVVGREVSVMVKIGQHVTLKKSMIDVLP